MKTHGKISRFLQPYILVVLCAALIFTFAACNSQEKQSDLWENALYREDTEFGSGSKTVTVEVKAEDQSVTFTLHTDEDTLGAALLAHGLITGKPSEFGLYIETVNGILADYEIDQSYWGFYQDGEYMMTGVDGTAISGGEHFELVRTK